MKKGDVLKLSKEGVKGLSGGNEGRKAHLSTLRFEYRCVSRGLPQCITVKRLNTGRYEQYHHSFLKKASGG